jgi:TPR repeat protein
VLSRLMYRTEARLEQDYGQEDRVAKSASEGVKRYRADAEQGDAEAQFKLGQIYFHGDGVVKDATRE